MKNEKSKEKKLKIRLNKKGKTVTFRLPTSLSEWLKLFEKGSPLINGIRTLVVAIVLIIVINMKDVFTSIEFSQEVSGTVVWVFVLLGMIAWGFK